MFSVSVLQKNVLDHDKGVNFIGKYIKYFLFLSRKRVVSFLLYDWDADSL